MALVLFLCVPKLSLAALSNHQFTSMDVDESLWSITTQIQASLVESLIQHTIQYLRKNNEHACMAFAGQKYGPMFLLLCQHW